MRHPFSGILDASATPSRRGGRRSFLRGLLALAAGGVAVLTGRKASSQIYTTRALGEEGSGGPITTQALGEEGGRYTTYALGEEGGPYTTFALGEEGGPGGSPGGWRGPGGWYDWRTPRQRHRERERSPWRWR